jgi:hypothetical protein
MKTLSGEKRFERLENAFAARDGSRLRAALCGLGIGLVTHRYVEKVAKLFTSKS